MIAETAKQRALACASTDRSKDLAKIHLYKKQLDMDDDTYRDMLERLTGKRSAGELHKMERKQVIIYLAKQKRVALYPGRPHNTDSNAQLRKIEALLAEAKYPWRYAVTIATQQCGKSKLEFCTSDELSAVINALIKDAKRHGRKLK